MDIPNKLLSLGGAIYDNLFPPYIRDFLSEYLNINMPERSAIDPNYVVPFSPSSGGPAGGFQPLGAGIITSPPGSSVFAPPTTLFPPAPTVTINLNGPATPQAVQDIGSQVGNVFQGYSLENGYGGATP